MTYTLEALPTTGSLFQLSQVFSSYGYEPKGGSKVAVSNTNVTGSNNRIYYKRPSPDLAGLDKWDSFTFTVLSRTTGYTSYPGTVTLVPSSGSIVGSGFLLGSEGWTIEGNKAASAPAGYEPYSRGNLLNHYIVGTDDKVNIRATGAPDQSLWYFVAPGKFLGNVGIAYGGSLQFSLASFSGDFTKLNDKESFVVILECATCDGPVGGKGGITLGYSMASLTRSPNGAFTGVPKRVSIPLKEQQALPLALQGGGWVKDPQNSLLPWAPASQCDIIQVLSRLSKVRILGDWTAWYETVGLDDVRITNTKGQLPLCAMQRPDASICTC